jgi:hypothetical protein
MRLLNSEKVSRKAHWTENNSPFFGKSIYKTEFQPFEF